MKTARLLDVGRQRFAETLRLQRETHARVARGAERDTWIVVEHEPVVTLGRNAKREHLLLSPEALRARGVDCFEIERGGDATYHGPGQIVVYPIARLERFREVVPLVTAMESAAIATCAHYALRGERWGAHRGVYTGSNQICAIGLAVKQMTSLHGLAFNVSTDLDYDRLITPCGIRERGVTSLERELGRRVDFDEVKAVLLGALAAQFGVILERADASLQLAAS
jgi:lipoyl(octanoyl) transferase